MGDQVGFLALQSKITFDTTQHQIEKSRFIFTPNDKFGEISRGKQLARKLPRLESVSDYREWNQ